MFRLVLGSVIALVVSGVFAAPRVDPPDVKTLVAGLNDPAEKVRDDSTAALRGRADALPWLRRVARSRDRGAARAADLLESHEAARQEVAPKAIDACVRDRRIDLLTEWHQYWQPDKKDDLWALGPQAAKPGLDLLAKSVPKVEWAAVERRVALIRRLDVSAHDAPCPDQFNNVKGVWNIRTDRMDRLARAPSSVGFVSVAGPAQLPSGGGGTCLALGPVQAHSLEAAFVACDGDVCNKGIKAGAGTQIVRSVVVCRGNVTGRSIVAASVLLVDGEADLTGVRDIQDSVIRATGEVRLAQGTKPVNCTIEPRTKDATAPYRFFELTDVGLSVAAGKSELVVTAIKADSPCEAAGLMKDDLIRAVDDTPVNNPEQLRKAVRRALVRQGDCLLTVTRGGKSHDLAVFFPTPK